MGREERKERGEVSGSGLSGLGLGDGACEEGADAVEEGLGTLAGFAGVLFVDYFCDPVICDLPYDRELANLRSPFRFDKARSHDM